MAKIIFERKGKKYQLETPRAEDVKKGAKKTIRSPFSVIRKASEYIEKKIGE